MKGKISPYLISGDFDGNKKKDYAIQIVHQVDSVGTKELVILALLQHKKEFTQRVLETMPWVEGAVDIILECVPKGTLGDDLEKEKRFIYPVDGIGIGFSDKASISYIWRKGKFERVITGD